MTGGIWGDASRERGDVATREVLREEDRLMKNVWKTRAVGIARAMTIGAFAVSLLPIGAGARGAEMPLDMTVAMIQPADAAGLGYENMGYFQGSTYSWDEWFRQFIDADEPPVDFGITTVTTLVLDPIGGLENADGPLYSFFSVANVYADEDVADEDFEAIVEEWRDTGEIIDEDAGIGDESFVVQWDESPEDSLYDESTVSVQFRLGNIQADFSITGYDEEVDADDVIELAELYADRIETLVEDGEVDGEPVAGLTARVPRYEGDDLMTGRAHYVVYDGNAIVDAYDPESAEVLQDRADAYNMIAQYASSIELVIGDSPANDDPLLRSRVSVFDSAADAENYVNDRAEDLEMTPNISDVVMLDVPAGVYEDGAVSAVRYSYTFPDGVVTEGTRIFVQDGEYVYDVSLAGFSAPDFDTVLTLLDDTIACGQDGCAEPMRAPAELLDYLDEQREIVSSASSS
jgi:hypothetical protein